MLGLAIFFISNVETDRKTSVLVFETCFCFFKGEP